MEEEQQQQQLSDTTAPSPTPSNINPLSSGLEDVNEDGRPDSVVRAWLQALFQLALVWSVGAVIEGDSRVK